MRRRSTDGKSSSSTARISDAETAHRGRFHEALAVLHRASGQRCTTWAAVCRVLHSFARLFRSAKNEQQTSAFVKAMQSMLKDDVIERSSVSPRAAPEQRSSHLLRSRRRRACVAPREPGRLQSDRGRKWPSPHDVLSRTPEAGSTKFARFTSPVPLTASKPAVT